MGRGQAGKMKCKGGKKGQGGSRWIKGDSCVSNPQSRKFRDAASSQYFHQVTSNSLLTVNNVQSRNPEDEDDFEDDVLSADVQSLTVSDGRTNLNSFSTYKTFASDWSKCSNTAFERFLTKFKMDSALHKDMLSILAATAEVINSLGGTHKETEYFASLVTTIENCDVEQYPAITALFSIIVGKVPEAILKKKFSDVYPKIESILSSSIESSNHLLTRTCCDILRKIVGIQDPRLFEQESSLHKLLYTILKCCLHENPKVRKKARLTIGQIMNQQKAKGSDVVQKLVLGWIRDQLSLFPTCGTKVAADVLNLFQFVWNYIDSLQDSAAQKMYESVLRVMSSGDNSIVKTGFSVFSSIFKLGSCVAFEISPGEFVTAKVLSTIWKFCPDWRNGETFISWLRCVLDGLVLLSDQNEEIPYGYVARILEKLSPTWSSSFGFVASRVVTEYLQHLIKETIGLEHVDIYFRLISKNLISIPPNLNCISVLSSLLNSLTPLHFCPSAREVLLQLIPLRVTTNEVGNVIGQFLKTFGIENLWMSVSKDVRITVILPLVRENLHHGKFSFWKENILPLANQPDKSTLVWDSFVGFCREPEDSQNFPAQLLGKVIVEDSTNRLSTLAALRQMGVWTNNKTVMEKYARNYLPLLFNLFIKEKEGALDAAKNKRDPEFVPTHNRGHADAITVTIQEYLQFCQPDLILELAERASTKFTATPSTDHVVNLPLLDLLGFLAAAEIDSTVANKLLEICSNNITDLHFMKRVYGIMTALLDNDDCSDEIKDKICQLIRSTKGQTKSNAEPVRLNCINRIVHENETLTSEFLPEIILNLLSVNGRARKISQIIVDNLCTRMKEMDISIVSLMDVIELGLKSGNAFITSCTIHFMTVVYRDIRPADYNESLIKQCINHILRKENASITRESLGFISLNLSLYKSRMGLFASSIGESLASGGVPRRDMNRMLAKMIKIFGVAGLKAVLPNSEDPKMHNRIKNLQKKLKKVKATKAQEKQKSEMDGENEESDEDVMDTLSISTSNMKLKSSRNPHSQKLIIKEGVVNFLDPGDMTASLINKPREVKEDDQYKFAPDGRLIIEEPASQSGREKDDDDEELGMNHDDELRKGSRKRKHAGGSIASSHRSKLSMKSTNSSTPSFPGSKKGVKVISARSRIQAKRRKTSGSNASTSRSKSSRFSKK